MRRTLAELLGFAKPGDPLSSAEFVLWQVWYRWHGFDVDRIEWTTANAGALGAAAHGAKVKPADLIPVFEERTAESRRGKLLAWMKHMKGAPGGG